MSSRPRSIAINLSILALSALVALGLAELFVRRVPAVLPEEARLRLHWRALEGGTQTVGHPYLGFLYRPGTTMIERHGELDWSFTTDEHGFRNEGAWPASADIVLVGDSQALGYGVNGDEAWPRIVADSTGKRLVNLAIAGIGPEQERRIYETFGDALEPHHVLFGVFPGNDFADARQFQRWIDTGAQGSFAIWRAGDNSARGIEKLVGRSYLAEVVRLVWRGRWADAKGITLTLEDGARLTLVPSLVRRQADRARPGHRDFELVMDAIERAHADVSARGGRFTAVLFPTKEEVYMPPRGLEIPDLIGPVSEALEERAIAYIDLLPALRRAAADGPALFFEVDGHPNASGNAVIARAVIEYVRGEEAGTEP